MKRKLALLGLVAGLILTPEWVKADPIGTATAGSGIANSAHDFTQAGYAANPAPGLCTFCHTPHKAAATALLWNHTSSLNTTFSWTDNTSTQAGTVLPSFNNTWNGPTAKCLSCHDGSVAVGDVRWFDAQAQTISVTAPDLTGGKITNTAYVVGASGSMNGNHPVVVPFPGVGSGQYGGATKGGAIVTTEWSTNPTTNGIVLFKASDNTSTATISRVTSAPGAGDNLGIECASCHDPHNKLAQDQYFLRGMLTGNASGANGYICLKCHVK